jgi:Ca-activated chloride channel family protein
VSRAAIALLAAALAGFSPFEREEENVRAGNERLRQGDPAEALRRYDAAERAVGPRPEIDFDRGHAAFRAGRLAEAEEAFRRAARAAPPPLASRALQNAGNVLAAAGDRDGAARAFGEALLADPSNEDARFDLEVLLRERERAAAEDRPQPRADGADGRGPERPDAGAPRPAPAEPSRGGPPSGTPDGARPPGSERLEGEARGDARAGGEPRQELSRQDAEALLDALRAGERNMPLFGGRERKETRRRDGAKDW